MKDITQVDVNLLTADEFLEAYIEMRGKYQGMGKDCVPFVELLNVLVKMRIISLSKYKEFASVIQSI